MRPPNSLFKSLLRTSQPPPKDIVVGPHDRVFVDEGDQIQLPYTASGPDTTSTLAEHTIAPAIGNGEHHEQHAKLPSDPTFSTDLRPGPPRSLIDRPHVPKVSTSSTRKPNKEARDLGGDITEADIAQATRCGSGGFGDVFLVEHAQLGKLALKRLRETGDVRENAGHRRRARREARTWQNLEHPHILRLIGIYETVDFFYLVSPYAENGSLPGYLAANPQADKLKFLIETASALAYLHKKGIIHGDIKAANVLVSDRPGALLCDFGLSRAVDTGTSTTVKGQGTIRYLSPEFLLAGFGRTTAGDVWAFGMLIYEVLSGKVPFFGKETMYVYRALTDLQERPPTKPAYSIQGMSYEGIWIVASCCWRQEPSTRPSMRAVHAKLLAARVEPMTSKVEPGGLLQSVMKLFAKIWPWGKAAPTSRPSNLRLLEVPSVKDASSDIGDIDHSSDTEEVLDSPTEVLHLPLRQNAMVLDTFTPIARPGLPALPSAPFPALPATMVYSPPPISHADWDRPQPAQIPRPPPPAPSVIPTLPNTGVSGFADNLGAGISNFGNGQGAAIGALVRQLLAGSPHDSVSTAYPGPDHSEVPVPYRVAVQEPERVYQLPAQRHDDHEQVSPFLPAGRLGPEDSSFKDYMPPAFA